MSHNNILQQIRQSTLRQWRSTPTYFFLIWRWGTWIFAMLSFLTLAPPYRPHVISTLRICLIVTFLYSLIATLYAPVSRVLRLRSASVQRKVALRQTEKSSKNSRWAWSRTSQSKNAHISYPLLDTPNKFLNIAIYCLDVIVCGLITYYSAVNQGTPFGASSLFYRYGLSAVLVAGFTYSYGGGLLAALGYSAFIIYGAFFYPPGQLPGLYDASHRLYDLVGSLTDAPLIALLAAFVAGQLNKAIQNKHREQENVRREKALRGVSETLVVGINDQAQLLRSSVKAIRQGGHFEKLVIALIRHDNGEEPRPDFEIYAETDVSDPQHADVSKELVTLVAKTGRRHKSFDAFSEKRPDHAGYGIARLYQPFFKEQQIYLVIGAERTRIGPFEQRQEEFLATVGPQLVVALENIRLTEETAELATVAERARIAREIHDGVAQLLYMLSLNSETCLALIERVAENAEDGGKALAPISSNLTKQVTISKQALWETRHYMFMLRPMLIGNTTLTQMLTSQVREFETISGLSTHLVVEGQEEKLNGDQQHNRRWTQVGTAIFRITQEALTNAYKHAEASQIEVRLRHHSTGISVEISDNGKGMLLLNNQHGTGTLYSGRGLQGIKERAAELGGSLKITADSTGGTCVIADIPIG